LSTKTLLPSGQIVFNNWYSTEEGQRVISATNGGMLMFMWEAECSDGKVIRQFDDVNWMRAMTDEDFVPPENLRLSVDILGKELVSQFTLYPIAMIKKCTPWFQKPIVVRLNPSAGQRLTSFWETDYTPRTGYILRRTVVGIKHVFGGCEIPTYLVISPSGNMMMCGSTNQSFEGE